MSDDLISRAAAVEVAMQHRSKIEVNEPLWHEGQDWAADRIAEAISAIPAAQVQPEPVDWRTDPAADDRWCAGNDYALTRLCAVLKVDPHSVDWDGSDGGLEEEADALIWRILRANHPDYSATPPAPDDLVQAKDAEIARLRAAMDVAVVKAWKMGRDASVQSLQEAVDDWRSTGNELPARKIEDEIPAIRALTPPDDQATKIGGDA